jgi:hypothetical protein
MVANSHPPPTRKHSLDEWRFDYIPKKERWETYRRPQDWPPGLYKWLFDNFGLNLSMDSDSNWDYHGGWIYFYNKECVALFKLTW